MRENRDLVADMVAALNKADLDRFLSYYAENVSVEMMGRGRTMHGVEAVRAWIGDALEALDGFSNEVLGIYDHGDTVALEVVARGTANRNYAGRESGEALDKHEVYIYSMRAGKISGVRCYY